MFVLIMLFDYGAKYVSYGQTREQTKILNDFKVTVSNVVLTGNVQSYNNFANSDFKNCFKVFDPIEGLSITCGNAGQRLLNINAIFDTEKNILLEDHIIDYGFWRYHFVTGMGVRRYVFFFKSDFSLNPYPTDEELEKQIIPLIRSLPLNGEYSLCRSDELKCGNKEYCNRFDFENYTSGLGVDLWSASCDIQETAYDRDKMIIIEITSGDCEGNYDVCFRAIDRDLDDDYFAFEAHVGNDTFFVKNEVDFVSLVLGNDDLNGLGVMKGKEFYETSSKKFLFDMNNILNMLDSRSILLDRRSRSECDALWSDYGNKLNEFKLHIEQGLFGDSNTEEYTREYLLKLKDLEDSFYDLNINGCDYSSER